AFFVQRYEVKPAIDMLHAMHDGTFDPRNVAYFESAPQGMQPLSESVIDTATERVDIVKYENERVEMTAHAKGLRLLFFSDTWYPDWSASIDGKAATIYKADHAFRAIEVPSGE